MGADVLHGDVITGYGCIDVCLRFVLIVLSVSIGEWRLFFVLFYFGNALDSQHCISVGNVLMALVFE